MPNRPRILQKIIEWLPLVVVLGVALSLRLLFFTGMVRGDALNYAHAAYYLSRGVFDISVWVGMSRVGMYIPVAILYSLFGPSEFVTLIYPLASSLASILFVYLIAKMFAGEGAGLIAALFWAFLPLDIHLSTSLLPDAPTAAFCTGSVYFFFKAHVEKRNPFYLASALLLAWAILVKPLAIVTALFFIVVLAARRWPRVRDKWLGKYLSKDAINKYAIFGLALLILAIFLYLQMQHPPFLVTLSRADNDLGSFLFTGSATLDFGELDFSYSDLTIYLAPLFLVSILMLISQSLKNLHLLLLWGAVLFLYYEWGTISTNVRVYLPLQAFNEARYFLFVLAPFVVLVGVYLSQRLAVNFIRWTAPIIGLLALAVAIVDKSGLYSPEWTSWTALSSFLLLTGSIASPALMAGKNLRVRHGFVALLLLVLCLSLLQPFLPYHALMFRDSLDWLNGLRATVPFWNEHTDYPICASDAISLNYASNFRLGFNWNNLDIAASQSRILGSPPQEWQSCYVVTQEQQAEVPIDWWLVTSYSSGQQVVYIYRALNKVDAAQEYLRARQALSADRSAANLEKFYGASINNSGWTDIFPAWIELHHLEPDKYSLEYLEQLVSVYLEEVQPDLGENQLRNSDFSQGLQDWSYPKPEDVNFDAEHAVTIEVGAEAVGLIQDVLLQPSHIYFLTLRISTGLDMEADILRVGSGDILDSFSWTITANYPADLWAVFVTPPWEDPKNVPIELYVPFGTGRIWLQNPGLYIITSN